MKQFTVAIIGAGSRGADTYAAYQDKFPQRMKIVAIADPREERLNLARQKYRIPSEACFDSAEALLSRPAMADVCIIATPDETHAAIAIPALEKGYHLLLEKPIALTQKDVLAIRQKTHDTGKTVAVCHVLRYTPFYTAIKQLLDSRLIGDSVSVQAIEQVGYWHQAHSFVRGNWRRGVGDSSMILQKSCHDMDILLYLINRKCLRVCSFGGLYEFRPERAPIGSALRCLDGCACKESCPFDAEKIYIQNPVTGVEQGCTGWPCDVLTPDPTRETVMQALRTGPYGRCVYHCDNDALDHQTVNMEFEGGVTASFTMCGLTKDPSRQIKIMGTRGQIDADMGINRIWVTPFGEPTRETDITAVAKDLEGHGGGDYRMMSALFDAIEGTGDELRTGIDQSVESHLICFAAERSRKAGGRVIEL